MNLSAEKQRTELDEPARNSGFSRAVFHAVSSRRSCLIRSDSVQCGYDADGCYASAIRMTALLVLSFLFWGLLPDSVAAAEVPVKRIAYLEAGNFWLYDRTWSAFRESMESMQDIRCQFPEDAHISPGWEPEHMATLPDAAVSLMQRTDIDLIVGMGTAAVKALLAANNGHTPILGMGMADPIAAGVVLSAADSGADNFTCHIVTDRWSTMFRVFYDVVRFRKLGIMYQDTPDGKVYAALDDARTIAAELGFEVVEYNGLSSAETTEECEKGLADLHVRGMDAFFIGPLNCFDWQASDVRPLLDSLNSWKIPTFARDGSDFVKAGALMGFSTWNFGPTGQFLARQGHAMLTGTKARSLSMLDRAEPSIALNLATAKRIGFSFPLDVLVVSDELFETITLPADRKVQ